MKREKGAEQVIAILTGYGINADKELGEAFTAAGGSVEFVHLRDLIDDPSMLESFRILAFPGGFSFGDHIGSGTILGHMVKNHLQDAVTRLIQRDGLVLGICNGFQTLVKMGLLPNTQGDWTNEASLISNESGLFIDDWVGLTVNTLNPSPWIRNLPDFDCPIRHGEGKFIYAGMNAELKELPKELVAFRYQNNPNGSQDDIAGITDPSGRVLGMMPHPEAFIRGEQHPLRLKTSQGAGLSLFRNAVAYVSPGK